MLAILNSETLICHKGNWYVTVVFHKTFVKESIWLTGEQIIIYLFHSFLELDSRFAEVCEHCRIAGNTALGLLQCNIIPTNCQHSGRKECKGNIVNLAFGSALVFSHLLNILVILVLLHIAYMDLVISSKMWFCTLLE